MSEIIDINMAKRPERPIVLFSTYTLTHTDDTGTAHKLELTGDETVTTHCPECDAEVTLTLLELANIMAGGEFDFYGTSVLCRPCTKNRRAT